VTGLARCAALAILALAPRTGVALDRQVFRRAEIEAAGLVRLGELMRLPMGWDALTRDGFRWVAVPPGTRAFEEPVTVRIDGVDAATGRFGVDDLNRVPVSLAEIDSVVFIGGGVEAPVVQIHTRNPDAWGAGTRAATGGESGDPGPFAYVDAGTVNVDRIGHDATFVVHGRQRSATLAATLSDQVLVGTDPAHEARWRRVNEGAPPHIDGRGYALRARAGTRALQAAATLETTRMRDVFFLDVLGRELPAESSRDAASVRMTLHGDRSPIASLTVAHATNTLDAEPNPDRVALAWRLTETRIDGASARDLAAGRVRFGAGVERRAAHASDALEVSTLWTARCGAAFERPAGWGGWELSVEGAWGPELDGLALEAALGGVVSGLAGGRGRAALRVVRTPFALERDMWPWLLRGLGPSLGPEVEIRAVERPGAAREARVCVAWERGFGRRIAFATGGHVRRLSNATQETFAYAYEPETERFVSPATLETSLDATSAGAYLRLGVTAAGGAAEGTIGYRVEGTPRGDGPLVHASRRSARHILDARLLLRPEPSLALALEARMRSATFWRAYVGIEEDSAGRYAAALPAFAGLDVIVTKWLGARRAAVSLRLENVTNARVRTDPIGPTSRFAAFAAASLHL
jgi:hypothetical protein